MKPAKPITEGVWECVAKKRYQHISGLEVVYRCNTWDWEIKGGPQDGHRYKTLNVAQHAATLHYGRAS